MKNRGDFLRKPLIAGNWKMNKTIGETASFFDEFLSKIKNNEADVLICPTSICISKAIEKAIGKGVSIGAQNMFYKENGAFTGEISPIMLKEIGISHVILGHSERRQYFKEDDSMINLKVKCAIEHDIIPVFCIGETLEERESGNAYSVLEKQLKAGLTDVEVNDIQKIFIAYEPIWAIGTGKTATKEDANETIKFIRQNICQMFGEETSNRIRILYGGSVKSSNINELMSMSEIDGVLVGGASLDAEEFSKIVNYKTS